MRFMSPGQSSSGARPILEFFAATDGLLVNLYSLAAEIVLADTGATVLARTTVNVGTTYPTAGAGRLSIGRYFLPWTVPGGAVPGRYEVRWYYKWTSTSEELMGAVPFEIVGTAVITYGCCGISDLRREGVTAEDASDPRALLAISRATTMIERALSRWFEPRYARFVLDGHGKRTLNLPMPIIGIEGVRIDSDSAFSTVDPEDTENYEVYSRHLTGLVAPDDRIRPRLERGDYGRWSRGRRNIEIAGAFGFTEYDGTPMGGTPSLLVMAAVMLANQYLPRLADLDPDEPVPAGPITSESVQGHSISYADNAAAAPSIVGDATIDALLAPFRPLPIIAGI